MAQNIEHVERVGLQTSSVDEQDDAQIEELLSSFYFDNAVKQPSTGEGASHGGSTCEHLHPIYEEQEEDGMFYELYGALEEEERPCFTCESSDDEGDDSEASSQYGLKELPPDTERNPSSFWPVIEDNDDAPDTECCTFDTGLSSHEEDDEDREPRGRSRAVPARLVRRAKTQKGQGHRFIHEQQEYEGA